MTAVIRPLYADRLPERTPTLAEAALTAVEAGETAAAYNALVMPEACESARLQARLDETREQLIAALGRCGVWPDLAARLARILSTPHPGDLPLPIRQMPAQAMRDHSREGSDGPLPAEGGGL